MIPTVETLNPCPVVVTAQCIIAPAAIATALKNIPVRPTLTPSFRLLGDLPNSSLESHPRRLPFIKTVLSSSLSSADGESDHPQNEEDDRQEPEHMEGEPESSEDQHYE